MGIPYLAWLRAPSREAAICPEFEVPEVVALVVVELAFAEPAFAPVVAKTSLRVSRSVSPEVLRCLHV